MIEAENFAFQAVFTFALVISDGRNNGDGFDAGRDCGLKIVRV
jgi:hypothetical protein